MQTLETAFGGIGFDPSRPAVFIWEGVTQYIAADAVSQTLIFLGLGLSPYVHFTIGCLILIAYMLLSIQVYVRTCAAGEFGRAARSVWQACWNEMSWPAR